MLRAMIVLASVVLPISVAGANSVELPKVKAGDSWVCKTVAESGRNGWREMHKEFSVIRTSSKTILVSIKEVGSKQPANEQLMGNDWSLFKNFSGKEVVVSRPFKFPLDEGKEWSIDFTEDHPSKDRKYRSTHLDYKVVGWEEIDVPAGKFNAIKVEAEGDWKAEIEPSVGAASITKSGPDGTTTAVQTNKSGRKVIAGRLYKAFWYEPSVKRFVKVLEEDYDVQGVRNGRYTMELESFKVAK